jgi:hypothetical protein
MIKAEQIPDEAATEGMRAIYEAGENLSYPALNAAIAAALAAWPGAEQTQLCGGRSGPALILPLSQEGAADLNEGDDELLWRRD